MRGSSPRVTGGGTERISMRRLAITGTLVACLLVSVSGSSALSQTLPQIAAYILGSGSAELEDLKRIDDNAVQFAGQFSAESASPLSVSGRDLPKIALDVIRVINRRQCEFANLNVLQSGR